MPKRAHSAASVKVNPLMAALLGVYAVYPVSYTHLIVRNETDALPLDCMSDDAYGLSGRLFCNLQLGDNVPHIVPVHFLSLIHI